jgi:hypothetical protein
MASDLHRTAQPRTRYVPILGTGAGRTCRCKYTIFFIFFCTLCSKITLYIGVFKIKTMKKYNLLSIILLAVTLSNCGYTKKVKTLFTFDNKVIKTQYEPQDQLDLVITNDNAKAIDSIIYYVNDKKIGSSRLRTIDLCTRKSKIGYQNLKALVYYDGTSSEATRE